MKRPQFHLALITLTYDLVNLPSLGAAGLWHMQCPLYLSLATPDLEN